MQNITQPNRLRDSVLKSIAQLFLIVFSVVLGLFLSGRIEEQKDANEAAKLMAKITAELSDNKNLVEDWAPYHAGIARKLDSLSHDDRFVANFIEDKTVLFSEVLTEGTFMRRLPSSNAWDIAKSHPLVVNFDYDELLILSKIYNQQQSAFKFTDEIAEIFFSPDFNSQEKAKSNLQSFSMRMREFVSREMQLIQYFREAEGILRLQNE